MGSRHADCAAQHVVPPALQHRDRAGARRSAAAGGEDGIGQRAACGGSPQRAVRLACRRGCEETAEAALVRKGDASVVLLMRPGAAKFWYIRRRLRLTTFRSFADTPEIVLPSSSIACGITRARIADPFGVRHTVTSRLLVADRVRVTSPILTIRVTTRDKVETSMLVLPARSIWRCPSCSASTARTRHIAMLS